MEPGGVRAFKQGDLGFGLSDDGDEVWLQKLDLDPGEIVRFIELGNSRVIASVVANNFMNVCIQDPLRLLLQPFIKCMIDQMLLRWWKPHLPMKVRG